MDIISKSPLYYYKPLKGCLALMLSQILDLSCISILFANCPSGCYSQKCLVAD